MEVVVPIVEPGDYQLVIEDRSKTLAQRTFFARSVPCGGARPKLFVREARQAILEYGNLRVPRWVANDFDASFVVEWLHEGKKVFETRGRNDGYEKIAQINESTPQIENAGRFCAFDFGETYKAPTTEELKKRPGAWEVRVHREGQASLIGHFTVVETQGAPEKGEVFPSGKDQVQVALARMDTPADMASVLASIPSSCSRLCPVVSQQKATTPGRYASDMVNSTSFGGACARPPKPAHLTHWKSAGANIPHPLMYTPEEFRASIRSGRALVERVAINHILYFGQTSVVRGDWTYDVNQSPEANWHARRAYEARDLQGQVTEEAQRNAQALKLVPALRKAIEENGGPWDKSEIPAPPEGLSF